MCFVLRQSSVFLTALLGAMLLFGCQAWSALGFLEKSSHDSPSRLASLDQGQENPLMDPYWQAMKKLRAKEVELTKIDKRLKVTLAATQKDLVVTIGDLEDPQYYFHIYLPRDRHSTDADLHARWKPQSHSVDIFEVRIDTDVSFRDFGANLQKKGVALVLAYLVRSAQILQAPVLTQPVSALWEILSIEQQESILASFPEKRFPGIFYRQKFKGEVSGPQSSPCELTITRGPQDKIYQMELRTDYNATVKMQRIHYLNLFSGSQEPTMACMRFSAGSPERGLSREINTTRKEKSFHFLNGSQWTSITDSYQRSAASETLSSQETSFRQTILPVNELRCTSVTMTLCKDQLHVTKSEYSSLKFSYFVPVPLLGAHMEAKTEIQCHHLVPIGVKKPF